MENSGEGRYVIVFCFFQEKGEDPQKGVSKANYGGRGCAAQHRGPFYCILKSGVTAIVARWATSAKNFS